jgi:gluconokinase
VNAAQVVVMGVSGCGKSTIARALAAAMAIEFVEGDDLHPPANVQRMRAGFPLTDHDREEWLIAIGQRLGAAHAAGQGLVVACSALKRRYRDRLRAQAPGLRLLHLHGDESLLAERLSARSGHYMPPSLLPSQLDALEAPAADEDALVLDIRMPPARILEMALAGLSDPPGGASAAAPREGESPRERPVVDSGPAT